MSKEIPIPGTLVSSDEVDLSKFSIPIEDTEINNEVVNAYDRYKDSSHVSFIDWLFEHYTITRKK